MHKGVRAEILPLLLALVASHVAVKDLSQEAVNLREICRRGIFEKYLCLVDIAALNLADNLSVMTAPRSITRFARKRCIGV
jgi:hypothetical protein